MKKGDAKAEKPQRTKLRDALKERKKVSGTELETRFDGWRDHRREVREARTAEEGARVIRRGVSVLLGVGILAGVVFTGVSNHTYASSSSKNEATISELRAEHDQSKVVPKSEDIADEMVALNKAAADDAKAVRDAQQTYADLYYQAGRQSGFDNGAPNQAMLDTAEHRKDLAEYFDESSYLVDDDDAYTWQNVLPFDEATEIDPRFAWYVRYDGWEAADSASYTWSVETVMPEMDVLDGEVSADKARVVWVCRDAESETVLAWANAIYTYDGDDGTFSQLELVVTSSGAEDLYPGSKKADGSDVPELSGPGGEKGKKGGTKDKDGGK